MSKEFVRTMADNFRMGLIQLRYFGVRYSVFAKTDGIQLCTQDGR